MVQYPNIELTKVRRPDIGVNKGETLLINCVTGDFYWVTILRPRFSGTMSCTYAIKAQQQQHS